MKGGGVDIGTALSNSFSLLLVSGVSPRTFNNMLLIRILLSLLFPLGIAIDTFVNRFVHMRSVDTVKTRLQGQPSANPPKYHNMFHAYGTILREEGVTRGLYSGVAPAMTGSCKSIILLLPREPNTSI